MPAYQFLKISKFFCALCVLLAIAFAFAKDSWHTNLFFGGGILWAINIAIWAAVTKQEEEDEGTKR